MHGVTIENSCVNIVFRIANDLDFEVYCVMIQTRQNMVVIIQGRCHEENHTATKAMNTLLIDMKPSDPSFMMRAKFKSVLPIFGNFYFRSAIIQSVDNVFP